MTSLCKGIYIKDVFTDTFFLKCLAFLPILANWVCKARNTIFNYMKADVSRFRFFKFSSLNFWKVSKAWNTLFLYSSIGLHGQFQFVQVPKPVITKTTYIPLPGSALTFPLSLQEPQALCPSCMAAWLSYPFGGHDTLKWVLLLLIYKARIVGPLFPRPSVKHYKQVGWTSLTSESWESRKESPWSD